MNMYVYTHMETPTRASGSCHLEVAHVLNLSNQTLVFLKDFKIISPLRAVLFVPSCKLYS